MYFSSKGPLKTGEHNRFRPVLLCILEGTSASAEGGGNRPRLQAMKIAKPLLLVSTPLGMVTGLIEAYRMVGGLAVVMFAMMGVLGVAAASVVPSSHPP
jgi:hypothetical protein